jgi:16S rRNA G1207 methylase RsmC
MGSPRRNQARNELQDRAGTARVDGLNPDDPGIALLAEAVAGRPSREILLVCCGDVPGVGPEATRLVLDVREREASIARAVGVDEALGVGGEGVEGHRVEGFGDALVWPRPHLGKDFSVWCLARGALALRPGGALWCAARKAKGAESLVDELHALLGEVDVVARDKGYRLVRARRGPGFDEARARAHVAARYSIEDPALPGLSLVSAPGVFSRRELDGGTRQLLEHAAARAGTPRAVLDLGCGVGPLALWAATRWPGASVVGVDSNLRAVALARENAARHGLEGRVRVLASDGLGAHAHAHGIGPFSLALVNPPTHAEAEVLGRLAEDLRRSLAPGGVAMLVVSRPGRTTEQLVRAGARVEAFAYPRFTVLEARWG